MGIETRIRELSPTTLGGARAHAHKASQLLTMAARANLAALPDDSHSSLEFEGDQRRFRSQVLPFGLENYAIGLSVSKLTLSMLNGNQVVDELKLDALPFDTALAWLDERLVEVGLSSATSATLPYDLPPDVESITTFDVGSHSDTLDVLAHWFSLADRMLADLVRNKAGLDPGPSPVRCWPHHFDIATYVGLESGDPETASGIGVGMSPGDESYDQPYFYINPWPYPDASQLPSLPPPGHWHTEGFVGAIATGDQILSLDNIARELPVFMGTSFAVEQTMLGH